MINPVDLVTLRVVRWSEDDVPAEQLVDRWAAQYVRLRRAVTALIVVAVIALVTIAVTWLAVWETRP